MMKRDQNRRLLMTSLLAGSIVVGSAGCSSTGGFPLASINPFSKSDSLKVDDPSTGPSFGESIAASTEGARDKMSSLGGSLGTSAKTAVSKSTGAVKGIFASARTNQDSDESASEPDPLSLSNSPEKVGVDVFVANGRLWESTGNTQKAMESFTKALEAEPGNADALASIARLHFRNGEHAQAADFFGRAIKSTPEDAGLYNDLGLTLSKMGNHGAAAETLQRALTLAPGTSRYANNLASVLYDGGQTESAYGVLQQNNKPAVAHFNMAYLHHKNGKTDQARMHLNEAMKFEAQAVSDSSVKRAVTRSREMLVKLDGEAGTVAQVSPGASPQGTPQATIAARPATAVGSATQNVRQTSQSVPAASEPFQTPMVRTTSASTPTMLPPSLQASTTYGVAPSTGAASKAAVPAAATKPTNAATTKPADTQQQDAGFELPPGFNPTF